MEVKHYIENYDSRIYYTLFKTKRKTIGITVDRNDEVKVSALSASAKNKFAVVQKKQTGLSKSK